MHIGKPGLGIDSQECMGNVSDCMMFGHKAKVVRNLSSAAISSQFAFCAPTFSIRAALRCALTRWLSAGNAVGGGRPNKGCCEMAANGSKWQPPPCRIAGDDAKWQDMDEGLIAGMPRAATDIESLALVHMASDPTYTNI